MSGNAARFMTAVAGKWTRDPRLSIRNIVPNLVTSLARADIYIFLIYLALLDCPFNWYAFQRCIGRAKSVSIQYDFTYPSQTRFWCLPFLSWHLLPPSLLTCHVCRILGLKGRTTGKSRIPSKACYAEPFLHFFSNPSPLEHSLVPVGCLNTFGLTHTT